MLRSVIIRWGLEITATWPHPPLPWFWFSWCEWTRHWGSPKTPPVISMSRVKSHCPKKPPIQKALHCPNWARPNFFHFQKRGDCRIGMFSGTENTGEENLNMVFTLTRQTTEWKPAGKLDLMLYTLFTHFLASILCFCKTTEIILSVLFLAVLCTLWDLSSLTRDWTHTPWQRYTESLPLDHQEFPKRILNFE